MKSPMNTKYLVTSYYGWRDLTGNGVKDDFHNGIDLVPQDGKHPCDIVAAADGTVVDVRSNVPDSHTGLGVTTMVTGNYVNIRTKKGYTLIYRHLKSNSVTVKVGDKVKAGDKIGVMGTTGQSTGIHLHYEIRDLAYLSVDPMVVQETPEIIAQAAGPAPGAPTLTPVFKVGDKVQVKKGARDYSGTSLASFVFMKEYDVIQATDDRIVIGTKGEGVTAAVKSENLIKV